jgi:hypothetical protein
MLKYTGDNGRAVLGIPARDLSDDEVEFYGGDEFLLGFVPALYERIDKGRKVNADILAAKKIADKMEGE